MSTVMPTALADDAVYRDRKRYAWLLSVVAPLGVIVGPAAHLLGASSQLWFFVSLAYFYLGIPLLDKLLGEDLSNPPESAVPALEADGYYRAINYAVVPVLWFGLLFNCIFLATHELPWYSWLATVCISHCSWRVRGWVMICVPVLIFAIHLERNSEISEPAKPNTAQ